MSKLFGRYVSALVDALRPKSMSRERDVEKHAVRREDTKIPPKLVKFQTLIGICSPDVFGPNSPQTRPAPNEGIYKRTVDEEARVKFRFRVSSYVVNGSGLLQIIVAAALTALGAANGPKGAVTVLGAANTIMAGLLTYLKGQGLPTRLEQYLHLLRTLREHIEEREREFLEPGCQMDVDEEILRVAKMYQEVRQTAQDNAPGTVLPPRGAITTLLKKPDIVRSDVPAPRGDKKPSDMLMTGLQDLAQFGRHHGDGLSAKEEEALGYVKEAAESDLKKAGAEISHSESVAKDTLGKLSGSESSGERREPPAR